MYIQRFVKGIAGTEGGGPTWEEAVDMIAGGEGILSNWWRNKSAITPSEVQSVLTKRNLYRHLNDYANFGSQSPFISLASGCVGRNVLLQCNATYSAIDTALGFATDYFTHEGYLFYGWTLVGLNPAVELCAVAESVRDLNVYRAWLPYQLEGEITAKVHIHANQIERIERWDPKSNTSYPIDTYANAGYASPSPITNVRDLF